jgi:hypothetical protein
MRIRLGHVLALLCLLLVSAAVAQAAPSPVFVPDGTRISELKYGDEETALTLQPGEQVAFLFVYGVWGLEQDCFSADSGVGRFCTLAELVKGVKAPGGTLGLAINPVKDTNYSYDLTIIGSDLVIRAIPRVRDLGAFAMTGSGRRSIGNFWYSPKSGDLTKALQITQYGYGGSGFRR